MSILEIGSDHRVREEKVFLAEIEALDADLKMRFSTVLETAPALTRSLVSFQANKTRPVYRWYKYKEAFSAALIEHFFYSYQIQGTILDPFAGSGTALFAASDIGINADGIELLPIGQEIIRIKQDLDQGFLPEELSRLHYWVENAFWEQEHDSILIPELRITRGAYPEETRVLIGKYLGAMRKEEGKVKNVLLFALLCILEAISYTRKDGQYLRWDYRSGRRQGKKRFDKGTIPPFTQAITEKLREILDDLNPQTRQEGLFAGATQQGAIRLHQGSCLDIMPTLDPCSYDCIITSPPYCNRYDYTRTYALELALLNIDERRLVDLRQAMLSCTVENREKDLLKLNPTWQEAVTVVRTQPLLSTILAYLDTQREQKKLNNDGIPRMVKGYFYEMACIIAECARILKQGAPLFMVNDNVRYAGASISVDLILSDIARNLGFSVEKILVLPNGKGNSSQQMGEHGREALRKCVYVWRKE